MSLEDLKNDWDALGNSGIQNKISNAKIQAILKYKFRSFINRVLILETLILLAYLYFIGLIIFRFDELGINYLKILAVASIGILSLLFILRTVKLRNAYRLRFLNNAHATAVKKLAKQKVRVQRFYLLNIIAGFLLVVILIILNIKIYNEYDLIQSRYFWAIIIPLSLVFMVLINKWIKNAYTKVVAEAEALIQELE